MASIVLFVPREDMLLEVNELLQKEDYDIDQVIYVKTSNTINEARRVVSEGANIIIARGIQAYLIKSHTNIPVAEISLTGQEIGLLIIEAKKRIKKAYPNIGLIGSRNMFCDLTHFNHIFEINLKTYFGNSEEECRNEAQRAIQDQVDFIIGGDAAMLAAIEAGIPCMFLQSTEDSLKVAFRVAKQMKYASEVENRNEAQIETLMEYSFNGIIKLDSEGEILIVNRVMEEILGKRSSDVVGRHISSVISEIETNCIENIMNNGEDLYSTFLRINQNAVVVIIGVIKVEDRIEGAIVSCHKVEKIDKIENDKLREMYLNGYVAKNGFDDILKSSKEMQTNIETARLYAQSYNPVLIEGEIGTEKEIFAESIHNNSLRKNGPFISVNCSYLSEEMQTKMLFGDDAFQTTENKKIGVLGIANHGTVLINEIDQLGLQNQYRLYRCIKDRVLIQNDIEKLMTIDTRVIAACNSNLFLKMKKGLFREDLYYLLSGLSLTIPPLRVRIDDIGILVEKFTKEYMSAYSRYHVITDDAKKAIMEFYWSGNQIQLKSFCERMILVAKSRKIDDIYVKHLLHHMYPSIHEQKTTGQVVVYQDPMAVHIANALEKHEGNRTKVAEELEISKTTLWRHMKKYGISNKYET